MPIINFILSSPKKKNSWIALQLEVFLIMVPSVISSFFINLCIGLISGFSDGKVVGPNGATEGVILDSDDAQMGPNKNSEGQHMKKSPPSTPAFKKRHRGCSYCILDLENAPIPEFPPNEKVVGVISMEDVIEELLQEEILDETDEYVNIHNRIKVNMQASQEKASPGVPRMAP